MKILAVDTTTFAGSAAILEDTKLLSEVNIESSLSFSERLLPSIHWMLQATELKPEDIDGFAVAAGPGSFTGIRIGISTVKAFAYASKKPVVGVSTLEALTLKLRQPQKRLICPLLDAKKGEIYAALFEVHRNNLQEFIPQAAYNPDYFFSLLPTHRIINFIGNGINPYRNKIFQYLKDKARLSARTVFIANEVGLLAYESFRKIKGNKLYEVTPIYFRTSQAEEKHKQSKTSA